jgi:hypothetical protein
MLNHHVFLRLRHGATGLMAAGLLAGMAAYTPAQAIPVSFSFNFTYGGGTLQTYTPNGPGTNLIDATSITEGTDQFIQTVQSLLGPPAGTVGDAIVYSATPLAIPAGPSGAMPDQLTVNWGGIYSFVSVSGTYLRDTVNDALNFKWLGLFSDSSGVLDTQGAQFSQSWSQAAPGIQPNTAGTFNSNPDIIVVQVPEPGAMAIFGAGLLLVGFTTTYRRRRS